MFQPKQLQQRATRTPAATLLASIISALILAPISIFGQNTAIPMSPVEDEDLLMVDNWTTEQGLPSNYLNKVLQTEDGYLWVTCYSGLVRYDGQEFDIFNTENTYGLSSNSLGDMAEARDGSLWISSSGGGLVSFKNESFRCYGLEQGITKLFKTVYIDSKDRIWSGSPEAGWFYFQNGEFNIIHPDMGLENKSLSYIMEDDRNNLWFGTEANGIFRYSPDSLLHFGKEDGLPGNNVWCMYLDSHENFWVGTDQGLVQMTELGKFQRLDKLDGITITHLREDSFNNLWISTNQGLWVKPSGSQEVFEIEIAGEGNHFILGLEPDHEGNLWFIRLKGGLSRLKKGKFVNYNMETGLSSNVVNHISEYTADSYLLSYENGDIDLFQDGEARPFKTKTPLNGKRIKYIFKDSKGNLWICTYIGLLKVSPTGKETLFDKSNGFPSNLLRVCYEDSKGRIWVGSRDQGIIILNPEGTAIERVIDASTGLADNLILSLFKGPNNSILVGSSGGGLMIMNEEGEVLQHYTTANGLPSNVIFSARKDRKHENRIWVASSGGIVYIEGKSIKVFSKKQGLPENNVYDIQEDQQRTLWISSVAGVIKIKKQALLDYKQGEPINFRLYDRSDGLMQPECNATSKFLVDSKGTLWFPMVNGVASTKPSRVISSTLLPPVYINHFIADNDTIHDYSEVAIAPEVQRFRFHFAALYYYAPEKVKFKYRLEGFDKDWIEEVDPSQKVSYTNLPAGNYTFKVIASNDEGLWNTKGDSVQFSIEAYFYETIWFPVICVFLLAGATAGIYQIRVNQLKRSQAQLEALVNQRTTALKEHNAMLEQQREEIMAQRDEIEKQHKKALKQQQEITSSIQYARRIQGAILPPPEALRKANLDGFVLFKPRDIVSGDFYWMEEIQGKIAIVAGDCTGHGVPGAFMSVLGITLLNDIVKRIGVESPKNVLEELRTSIKKTLRQEYTTYVSINGKNKVKVQPHDGMDLSFCLYDTETKLLTFAGANNSIYIIRSEGKDGPNSERMKTLNRNGHILYEIKPDKQPIGIFPKERPFREEQIQLTSGDQLILFSDGYYDQIGGEKGRKFMSKNFKRLLLDISGQEPSEQGRLLDIKFKEWKKFRYKQIDDVLIIGIVIR